MLDETLNHCACIVNQRFSEILKALEDLALQRYRHFVHGCSYVIVTGQRIVDSGANITTTVSTQTVDGMEHMNAEASARDYAEL